MQNLISFEKNHKRDKTLSILKTEESKWIRMGMKTKI